MQLVGRWFAVALQPSSGLMFWAETQGDFRRGRRKPHARARALPYADWAGCSERRWRSQRTRKKGTQCTGSAEPALAGELFLEGGGDFRGVSPNPTETNEWRSGCRWTPAN